MESFLERLLQSGGPGARPPAPMPAGPAVGVAEPSSASGGGGPGAPLGSAAPRIAIYDTLTSPPRVVSVEEEELPALIASLATETYRHCREQGGQVPYTVIRELIENLIHAAFADVVITVLDGGQVVRISDHGPGIEDKERAMQPGFTTATAEERRYIRGVGSGLPIARESLAFLRGILTIEDNLGGGTVLTINLPHTAPTAPPPAPADADLKLGLRQKRILALLMELGSAGPTRIARELKVAPATAFRDLGLLEKAGLIHSVGDGKRTLTEEGVSLLDSIL
jgi:hypothetical protein